MKQAIHPQFFEAAQVVCACGNRFTTGSTMETIHIELCNKCHPFYTGEQRFVDSASKIDSYLRKVEIAKKHAAVKKQKVEEKKKRDTEPKSLREMLLQVGK